MSDGHANAYVCAYCAAVGVSMRFCSICRSTTYCSVACQKKDWKRHQLTCGQQPEAGSDSTTPEPQANEKTGEAAQAATDSTTPSTTTTTQQQQTTEAAQQLTHKDSNTENDQAQAAGLFSTTNIIIASALSVGLAVAGWFAYSYLGTNQADQRRTAPPPKGRRPPQQRR